MPQVVKTPQAERDLLDIWVFIAQDNSLAADNLLDEIQQKGQILAQSPKLGRARPELASELHSFPICSYIIFYRPIQHGIEIVRVLHGARDLPAVLEED